MRGSAPNGFVGDPAPDIAVPPFVLMLGPWPQRAIILVVLAVLGFVVVLLPWHIFAGRSAAEPMAVDGE